MKKSLTTTEKGLDIEVTSAGALLRNKNREFLFEIKPESYKRNPGSIMLFGGLFEVGDATPLDILKRELKEEYK